MHSPGTRPPHTPRQGPYLYAGGNAVELAVAVPHRVLYVGGAAAHVAREERDAVQLGCLGGLLVLGNDDDGRVPQGDVRALGGRSGRGVMYGFWEEGARGGVGYVQQEGTRVWTSVVIWLGQR